MKRYVVATLATSLCAGTPSPGVSGEAVYIDNQSANTRGQLQRSATFGNASLFDDLDALADECAEANWDGYGAVAVSPETIAQAKRILRSLPIGTARPSIAAEPDGQITLEWHSSPKRTLSLSIDEDGSIHYAALFGLARQFGTEAFVGEFPRTVLSLVHRVHQA